MSGVYPMMSSSPPPLDEEEGDDWDEDFGNFMGAGHDVSESNVSQDWAAFPDSGSNTTPTNGSTSTQENLNVTEETISTKSMELKLDANGSNLIKSSDSGLDLDSSHNHCTESVSHKGLNTVPHVDSGLFSSEVSPSDPHKNCDKGNGAGKNLRDSTKLSVQSSVLNEDSNGDFNDFETCPGPLPEDQSDIHTSGSDQFDSDKTVDSEIEIPVQHSVNDECKAGVHEDSTEELNADKSNEEGDTRTIPDPEDGRNLNENLNSSTSVVLDIGDKENKKSISVQNKNIAEEISEKDENPSSLSNSYLEEKIQTQDLNQESQSIKNTAEKNDGAINMIQNTCSYIDDNCSENEVVESDGDSSVEEKNVVLTTTGVNSKGASSSSSSSVEGDQNLSDEKDTCRKTEETSEISVTSVQNNAVDDGEDDKLDDFADFASAPLSDDVQVNEENNKTESQENRRSDIIKPDADDDFDDFADFNSPPSFDDTEGKSENKLDDQQRSSPITEETTTTNKCTVLKEDDDDDFADFNSSPSDDRTEVNSDNNEPDEQIPAEDTIIRSESAVIKQNDGDDEDDFDDFADFDSAPKRDAEQGDESEGHFAAFSGEATEEDSGNWASFQETTVNTGPKDGSTAHEDEWGNQDSGQWKDVDGDEWQEGGGDDFGDFGDFDEPEPRHNEKVDELSDRTVISCFLEDAGDSHPVESVAILENYIQSKESATQYKPPKVWNSLTKQMAESPLKWSQSRSSKQLLSSLHIDTRNILIGHKKPSVPIYASNLTLLEPTKGPAKPTIPEPTLVNTSKEEPQKQDIPPVQFDWSSSGLTNPLQGNNRKSLDLDFLVVQETETGGRSGVFDSELMHGQKPNLQPLENILASMKVSTVKKSRHTDKLGTEAARIIKSLPDLSFMQAKVLMFPIRHQAD